MHLTKIEISNIRSLDEYTLEIPRGNNSAVITGDNGVGKTTFLRCLAMSLCDESSAAALFRELRGKFISNKSRNTGGIIKLYLRTKNYEHYIIETKIESMRKFEKLSQTLYKRKRQKHYSIINSNDFPWGQIFVCGYGAGMRTLGTSSIDHYAPIDAVYTLFRYDEPLLNPELFLRRVKDEDKRTGGKSHTYSIDDLRKLLSKILNLGNQGGIHLTRSGIEISGPWGRAPIESVGDGYQSVVTWILDIVARKMFHGRRIDPDALRGIVLAVKSQMDTTSPKVGPGG